MTGTTAAVSLPLSGTGARLVIWGAFVVYIALAVWTLDGVRFALPTIIGLVILAGSCVLMTSGHEERVPRLAAALAVVGAPVNVLVIVPHLIQPGYSEWYLGAATFVCFYVALRGRRLIAWVGFVAMTAAAIFAYAELGRDVSMILLDMSRHAGVLVTGTVFSLGFASTAKTIVRLSDDAAARMALAQATQSAAMVRAERLAWVEELAGDLLRRISTGEPLSADERAKSGFVEAELRDSLRGRALYREPLASAVREVRHRGGHIAVLDDSSGGYPAERLDDLAAQIATHVRTAEAEKVTVRLLPPGRDIAVTIVFDGDRARRVELD
jgi:uncharacterized membrane protein